MQYKQTVNMKMTQSNRDASNKSKKMTNRQRTRVRAEVYISHMKRLVNGEALFLLNARKVKVSSKAKKKRRHPKHHTRKNAPGKLKNRATGLIPYTHLSFL